MTDQLSHTPNSPTTAASPWQATILTLFPEMFPGSLGLSLAGRAMTAGHWSLDAKNIRDFAFDKHSTVDDTPLGGGAGMVMRPDVIDRAVQSIADAPGPLFYLSPRGVPFSQSLAQELADGDGVKILCGRYEGVDQRVLDKWQVREVSLGDFVLSGGEPAAIAMLDATIRLLPGVMGSEASLYEESFTHGLLEYPHYTRPAIWDDRPAPDVLLSGHHKNINAWRLAEMKRITAERRPDLWAQFCKSGNDQNIVA